MAEFQLQSQKHNILAKARLVNEEFIVEKGSNSRYKWEGKGDWDSTYRKLHFELIASNGLPRKGSVTPNAEISLISESQCCGCCCPWATRGLPKLEA